MTDVAVADGGAAAPAETSAVGSLASAVGSLAATVANGTPVEANQPRTPEPLGPQTPVAEKPETAKPEPKETVRETLQKAQEKLKAKEAEEQANKGKEQPAKTPEAGKPAQQRDDGGRYARPAEQAQQPAAQQQPPVQQPSQQQSQFREAPARFSDDAKRAWETAPEPVRAEVHRAVRELEQGIQKYKPDAEAYARVKDFDTIARQNGRDLRQALERVVAVEQAFARSPLAGLDMVLQHVGAKKPDGSPITLTDVAYYITGQTPDQRAQNQNSEIASLRQNIANLENHIRMLSPAVVEMQRSSDQSILSDWTKDKPHYDQLRNEVRELVRSGMTPDQAYQQAVAEFQERAKAFGFVPQGAQPAPTQPVSPAPAAPNPAGQKSITGAPSSPGSNPARKKGPTPSIREALKQASAQHR